MNTNWYFSRGEETEGPVTDAQLIALINGRLLTSEHFVVREGSEEWQTVGASEFAAHLPPAPQVVPVAARAAAASPALASAPAPVVEKGSRMGLLIGVACLLLVVGACVWFVTHRAGSGVAQTATPGPTPAPSSSPGSPGDPPPDASPATPPPADAPAPAAVLWIVDGTFKIEIEGPETVALLALPDGRTLVGGLFASVTGTVKKGLFQLAAEGPLNPAFATDTDGIVHALALQSDGLILVGGGFQNVGGAPRTSLARLKADGSLDDTFLPAITGAVHVILPQEDGRILIGGSLSDVAGQPRSRVARLNADGSLDESFKPAPDADVWAIALQADGKIILGGDFQKVGDAPRNRVARLNADGTLDQTFHPNLSVMQDSPCTVRTIVVQPDGGMYVGGQFDRADGAVANGLVRLKPDGSVDAKFNAAPEMEGLIYQVLLEKDQSLFVAKAGGLHRLNLDGTIKQTFGTGRIQHLALLPDGRMMFGGTSGTQAVVARLAAEKPAPE